MTCNICFKPNAFIRTNQGIVWALCVFYTRDLSDFIHEKQEYVWPYMQKCSNSTRLNGWMQSKQTGEKQVDKLIERGIMSGWTATENFWLDDIEWLKSWRKFLNSFCSFSLIHKQEKKLVNEGTTTIHVVKWVRSWKKNYLLLETQSKAKCLTMQIFNLHFALNFVKVSVLSVMRNMYNVAW